MFSSTAIVVLLSWLSFFFTVVVVGGSGGGSALSTVAVSRVANQTLICVLLPSPANRINCTALPSGHSRAYDPPPGTGDFSAIAAGDGFLCALSSLPLSSVSMQWWDLESRSRENSKRVYVGPALLSLSAGSSHVCGVIAGGGPSCWRWPRVTFPAATNMSGIAVGGDFVCGLLTSGGLACFGNNSDVVGREPPGNYSLVASGERHACAVSVDGSLLCWGSVAGAIKVDEGNQEIQSLALGHDATCVLRANGTVACWGSGIKLPASIAGAQFMSIQAKHSAFCGILMSNYSLVCWGSNVFAGKAVVYDLVLPGTCVPAASPCSCGVLPGSGDLCVEGNIICLPCKLSVSPSFQASPPTGAASGAASGATASRGGGSKKLKVALFIAGGVAIAVCIAGAITYSLLRLSRSGGRVHDSLRLRLPSFVLGRQDSVPISPAVAAGRVEGHASFTEEFSIETLLAATDGFSPEQKIGSGSFGSVYRARLGNGQEVAIKRADFPSPSPAASCSSSAKKRRDRESAFVSELALLSRMNHRNLVPLVGYCREGDERVLVYEFMANGTLHDQLHHRANPAPAVSSWPARLRIALDAARGLEYLHAYAVPPIIHRDVKSANILLDSHYTAKVSDFGLSLLNPGEEEELGRSPAAAAPRRTAGTVGYMDPEYYRLQQLTAKSDVYSFGVVVLELLTGSRVIQRYGESGTPTNVVERAVPAIAADAVHLVLDGRLPPPEPCEIQGVSLAGYVAADCVRPAGRDRPTMSLVVAALERALAACGAVGDFSLHRSTTTRSI